MLVGGIAGCRVWAGSGRSGTEPFWKAWGWSLAPRQPIGRIFPPSRRTTRAGRAGRVLPAGPMRLAAGLGPAAGPATGVFRGGSASLPMQHTWNSRRPGCSRNGSGPSRKPRPAKARWLLTPTRRHHWRRQPRWALGPHRSRRRRRRWGPGITLPASGGSILRLLSPLTRM